MPDAPAPAAPAEDAFARVLAAERLRNARRLNRQRLAGVSLAFAVAVADQLTFDRLPSVVPRCVTAPGSLRNRRVGGQPPCGRHRQVPVVVGSCGPDFQCHPG